MLACIIPVILATPSSHYPTHQRTYHPVLSFYLLSRPCANHIRGVVRATCVTDSCSRKTVVRVLPCLLHYCYFVIIPCNRCDVSRRSYTGMASKRFSLFYYLNKSPSKVKPSILPSVRISLSKYPFLSFFFSSTVRASPYPLFFLLLFSLNTFL